MQGSWLQSITPLQMMQLKGNILARRIVIFLSEIFAEFAGFKREKFPVFGKTSQKNHSAVNTRSYGLLAKLTRQEILRLA
ncbi:MAG TPA: hypothetical protein V6C90_26910 [Coleofasciculaceae cyanobacterium]|jgi:hypothetical protein